MLNKMSMAILKGYCKAKAKVMKLGKNEDGMETLETIILVVVAIVVAGVVIEVLTGEDGKSGLIGQLFELIGEKIEELFD